MNIFVVIQTQVYDLPCGTASVARTNVPIAYKTREAAEEATACLKGHCFIQEVFLNTKVEEERVETLHRDIRNWRALHDEQAEKVKVLEARLEKVKAFAQAQFMQERVLEATTPDMVWGAKQ